MQLILTHGGSPEDGRDLGDNDDFLLMIMILKEGTNNNVVDNDDFLLMIMIKKVQTLSTMKLTQKHPSTLAKLSRENIVILIIIEFALTNVPRF